ncbi:uncharacterized protein LOC114250255 isoform X3 [Bombyx mandarina]|uniref:Uncharacterized protein LOC114250255 isoform X3 n=1 Tax=Bombyx mandarina TaxID=7092 RepID=A0A6J2KFY5_BOMMA|nr:uncharacterized protein LOC114250255 isoform X3 [Bombyx mandarina]
MIIFPAAATRESQAKASRIPIKLQSSIARGQTRRDRHIICSYWSKKDADDAGVNQTINVRYFNNMRSFKDKIKSYYSCNQNQCAATKERLEQHQQRHCKHDRNKFVRKEKQHLNKNQYKSLDGLISVTSIKPNVSFVKKSDARLGTHTSRSIPTVDVSNEEYIVDKSHAQNMNLVEDCVELKEPSNLTIEYATTSYSYKDKLQTEITKLISELKLNPDSGAISKLNREEQESSLNYFVETIYRDINEVNDPNYEHKLKSEIVKYLNKLNNQPPPCGVNPDLSITNIFHDLKDKILTLNRDFNVNNETMDKDVASINEYITYGQIPYNPSVSMNTDGLISEMNIPDKKWKVSAVNSLSKSTKNEMDFDVDLERSLSKEIQIVLNKIGFQLPKVEIADVISKLIVNAISRKADVKSVKKDICNALHSYVDLSRTKEEGLADFLLDNVTLKIDDISCEFKHSSFTPQLSGIVTVYTSKEKISPTALGYLTTSTPKKKRKKKDIPKMNKEETEYYDLVVELVTEWMDTLPKKFNNREEKLFKDTMIKDLTGCLVDEIKAEQIYPKNELELYLKSAMIKWVQKFSIYETAEESLDKIDELYNKIIKLPTPDLTKPHHGNRQVMENLKYIERGNLMKPDYIPAGGLHIEDEISIWVNEQPDDIYTFKDRTVRNKMIHDLAETIHKLLVDKRPEKEIQEEVEKWLVNVIGDDEKAHIQELVESLKDRVKNMPLQEDLEKNIQDRIQTEEAQRTFKLKKLASNLEQPSVEYVDPNTTMQEFVTKFVEHYCNTSDQQLRGALGYLLKRELIKLSAPTRKELYDNLSKSKPTVDFLPEKFFTELDYMRIVSDWLNTLPLHSSYRCRGNNHRIEFITNVVSYIVDIEEERKINPDAMNYDKYLADIIDTYIRLLAIPEPQQYAMRWEIKELLSSIAEFRNKSQSKTTALPPDPINLDDIISEFIQRYAVDEDDPLKIEVWTIRLLEEAKRIINGTSNPEALSKTQVYNHLHEVAEPGHETIKRFEYELDYIEEITDWLQNLPLLPITNDSEEENRAIMISELSEKIYDHYVRKDRTADATRADTDFAEYVKKWIERLPMDKNQESVIIPVVMQQLINRIEKSSKQRNSRSSLLNLSSIKQKNSAPVKCKTSCPKNKQYQKDPGKFLLEELNKFANGLSIKSENDEINKPDKDKFVNMLFKKIGDLNNDPKVFNNDFLYKEMLTNTVDCHLQDISELPKNINKLKSTLINNVIDLTNAIKEKIAGDIYKQSLQEALDASIPNPLPKQAYDPGFEIYKIRLVEMFILENFDHSNDDLKEIYEQRLKKAIDKYFQSARNKNALPLSKEQIYNELYSSLFKVPIPNETSVIELLEEVKLRCEIDAWFESLPIKSTDDVIVLLQWDKLLSTLAKRICEIERIEQKPDDKIRREINKLLEKLPLLPNNNIDDQVDKLCVALKSNTDRRKITSKDRRKDSKGKSKSKSKTKSSSSSTGLDNKIETGSTPTTGSPHVNIDDQLKKSPVDLIIEIVNKWCNDLPLPCATPQEMEVANEIKQFVFLKIIMKVSELNCDAKIFANDYLYNVLLDEELDKILSALPQSYELQQSKEDRKRVLKENIINTKCFIAEEKARYDYKQSLKDTVKSVLEEPKNLTQGEACDFNTLVEEIINDFLLYYHYQGTEIQDKQEFKTKLYEAVVRYFMNLDTKGNIQHLDPLMVRNQLISELAKVPVPSQAVVFEELREIVLKSDVNDFFNELAVSEKDSENGSEKAKLKNHLKITLTNKLLDLQRNGFNEANDSKIRSEINSCLQKLSKEVNPALVNKFINKLTGRMKKIVPLRDVEDQSMRNRMQSTNQSIAYNWHRKPESLNPSITSHKPRQIRADDTWSSSRKTPQSSYNIEGINPRSLQGTITSFPGFEARVIMSSTKDNRQLSNKSAVNINTEKINSARALPSSGPDPETILETDLQRLLPPFRDYFAEFKAKVREVGTNELQSVPVKGVAPKKQNVQMKKTRFSRESTDEESVCLCVRRKLRNNNRPRYLRKLFCDDFDDCRPWLRTRCRMPLTGILFF